MFSIYPPVDVCISFADRGERRRHFFTRAEDLLETLVDWKLHGNQDIRLTWGSTPDEVIEAVEARIRELGIEYSVPGGKRSPNAHSAAPSEQTRPAASTPPPRPQPSPALVDGSQPVTALAPRAPGDRNAPADVESRASLQNRLAKLLICLAIYFSYATVSLVLWVRDGSPLGFDLFNTVVVTAMRFAPWMVVTSLVLGLIDILAQQRRCPGVMPIAFGAYSAATLLAGKVSVLFFCVLERTHPFWEATGFGALIVVAALLGAMVGGYESLTGLKWR